MSEALTFGEVDRDGAIQETFAAATGDTRADLLRKAAIGGGALLGSGTLLGALAGQAKAAVPKSDVAILNFALTLEYLEAAFYAEAVRIGALTGELATFARVVSKHENVHVAFLKKALGSAAVAKPRFNFKGTTGNAGRFAATATVLEDTGVAAYAGQGPLIKTKSVVVAALSIHSVEARHAAWIRNIRGSGKNPVPAPVSFDKAKTKAQILAAVKGTGFIVS